jgi:hypothetical protein
VFLGAAALPEYRIADWHVFGRVFIAAVVSPAVRFTIFQMK